MEDDDNTSFGGFNETNVVEVEDVGDESVVYTSPSEPEKLFEEAVRKLNSYEHSLETLVKRFEEDGIPTNIMIQQSRKTEWTRNSDAFGTRTPVRTDRSAGGDHLTARTERQTSGDRQNFVELQIPFRTAEIILRILDEDLDKNHRSALRHAECFLAGARQNIANVKELLQSHLENGNKSQEPILVETNRIADDMFKIIEKLGEKLVECEVQNLSELLVRSMNDETRLTMLAKRPQTTNGGETINTLAMCVSVISGSLSRSNVFLVIFCCVVSYFVVKLMLLSLGREHLFISQPFQEDIKHLFLYLRRAFNWLIRIPFAMFK